MTEVVRVFIDRMRRTVNVDVDANGSVLRCEFEPSSLHDLVRISLGPPPSTPSAAEMEKAISGALVGKPWKDPRKIYKAAAVEVIRPYVSRFLRGAEVSRRAAEAMLDMKDWEIDDE